MAGANAEPTPLETIIRELVSIPTAPYREAGVRAQLHVFAEQRGLRVAEDVYGNVYVSYRRGRARRPLVLGAHMDHPGFVVTKVRRGRLALEFRGGLPASYGKGERLRLYREGARRSHGTAQITSVQGNERGRLSSARARVLGGEASEGDLALWDVAPCRIRDGRVHARACDDLIGAASVLATLDRLSAARANAHVIGLFTRAEEVGLCGASVAARDRLLPADALVVAVETSSMAGGRAEQGGGPIIRVGDLVHVFSPRMTEWMTSIAQALQREQPGFRYQRRLMDGGVTEATAYDLYGYETGAACVALGNYHNAGPNGRVRAESVDLRDVEGLVALFERMAVEVPRFERSLPALQRRYDRLGREAAPRLRRSAAGGAS